MPDQADDQGAHAFLVGGRGVDGRGMVVAVRRYEMPDGAEQPTLVVVLAHAIAVVVGATVAVVVVAMGSGHGARVLTSPCPRAEQ